MSTDHGGIRDLLDGRFGSMVAVVGRNQDDIVADLVNRVVEVIDRGKLTPEEKAGWHVHCAAKYDLSIFQKAIADKASGLLGGLRRQEKTEIMNELILQITSPREAQRKSG